MNTYYAEIVVMPHKELLDPQGKAVAKSMKYIAVEGVEDVRIGRHIQLRLTASNENEAHDKVKLACEKMLTNPIMENFHFTLSTES